SLEDKIICDLDKTHDLSQQPPQNCPKCGNPVDGHYCQRCALLRKKFKEDMFTYCIENGILQDSSKLSNDNINIANALQEPFVVNQDPGKNSSQSPLQINHYCCYGCGDPLEDIFCHQCTCKLCGNGAHYGYNCSSKVSIVPNPKPFNNQTVDELPQTLPSFDSTCYSEDGNSFTYDSKSNLVHDSPNVFDPHLQPPLYLCEFYGNDARYGHYCTPQVPFTYDPEPCYNQDFNFPQDFHDFQQQHLCCENYEGPRMSFEWDEYLDTVTATESNEFIKISVESLVPIPSESEGIPDNMCDVPFHDNSSPLDVSKDQFEDFSDSNDDSTSNDDDSFSIDNIEYVKASPSDSELVSSEVMEIVIPELWSTTTHSDSSLYDSFIFDLSINPFPPTDRSDFYEFPNKLTNNISLPEYDCFCFKNDPNSGDFTIDVVEDTFSTRVHDALPTHPPRPLNLDFILSSESLFAYVVRIFLPFLSYSVAPQYLLSFKNKDTIFDPGICSYHISSFMSDVSHRSGTFIKFKVLNGSPMEILFSMCSPMDQ
nr:hypothetical protein [Tanacetum cinerariifolium]